MSHSAANLLETIRRAIQNYDRASEAFLNVTGQSGRVTRGLEFLNLIDQSSEISSIRRLTASFLKSLKLIKDSGGILLEITLTIFLD